MTFAEECSIHDLAIFSVVVYLRTWLIAPIAVSAPLNYTSLSCGNSWFTHKVPHTTIYASTSKGLGCHLWYRSVASISLAPFDSRVSSDSKKCTFAAIEEVFPDYLSEKPSVK